MVHRLGLRFSLWIVAPGLAACAGTGPVAAPVEAAVMLVSTSGPTLALHTQHHPKPAAPTTSPILHKVVDAEGMGAFLETLATAGILQHATPPLPRTPRQALVIERDGASSMLPFVADAKDPRAVAFLQARSYFLQLFNHAKNYYEPADGEAARDKASQRQGSRQR